MLTEKTKHTGRGNPTKISKILLPMELETAISPCPCFATITELKRSGTLVPAAKIVKPDVERTL